MNVAFLLVIFYDYGFQPRFTPKKIQNRKNIRLEKKEKTFVIELNICKQLFVAFGTTLNVVCVWI